MSSAFRYSCLLALFVTLAPAYSQETADNGAPQAQAPVFQARDKLRRGLANTATGWLELPYKTFSQVMFGDRTPFEDLFIGLTIGGVKTVERTAVGLFEMATFPIPRYDPLLDPEYVSFSFEPALKTKKQETADPREGLHVQPPSSPYGASQ